MITTVKNFAIDFDKVAPHPLQSWAWGEARKQMGLEILRVGEYQQKNLINVYQLTLHPLPLTGYKIGYLPRSNFPSPEVLEYLSNWGKKNNVVFIKIEPYVLKNFKFQISNFKLKPSSHPLFPEWTQILDLTKSDDQLLENMHPKTRYNIRLAQKKKVYVKEMSDEKGFNIFSKLYFETCKRQRYFGHTPRYHKIIWQNLKKEIAHILIAFYQDEPLAAYELFYFKDAVYYPYGGSSLAHRNFMATNLLMFESIRFGKMLGAKKFDMWGSLAPNYNQNQNWAGFTRFKAGYGGKFVQMIGSFDLVIFPEYYKLYNFLHFLRNRFLGIKRLLG